MRWLKKFYDGLSWQTQLELRIAATACVVILLALAFISNGV
jgi:hypothetical protein